MTRSLVLAAAPLLGFAGVLAAQVGYPPHESPYRDLRETQEVTVYSGYYRAKLDPARVAPRSGPLVGALYQWRVGGPANLTVDLARVGSERRVLDPERLGTCPTASPECKSLGMFRWPLYMADVGLGLNLTGARSWRNVVPQLRVGAGLVSDFHTNADVGEFAFGTRFAFSWGGGIRWTPGGRIQIRADVLNRLYSVKYPTTYYQSADDGSVIFEGRQNRTAWLNNPGLSIGMSYLFSR
jgi:hypothetical protein